MSSSESLDSLLGEPEVGTSARAASFDNLLDEPEVGPSVWVTSSSLASTSRRVRMLDKFGPSTMTSERLRSLVRQFNLTGEYTYSLPTGDFPWEHGSDEIVIFREQFVAGLRLPLNSLIVEVLNHFGVTVGQLHSNSIRNVVGTISLYCEYVLPLDLEIFSALTLKKHASFLPEHRRAYYLSPRTGFKLLHELPSKVPAWKRYYFVVRSATGWPFPTHWRAAIHDLGAMLDKNMAETFQSWAQLGLECKDYLTEAKLSRSESGCHGGGEDLWRQPARRDEEEKAGY
ncbi:PREDICTED: uncharacterized protein LOC104610243 [Nelumbo nucifera]|uniref:Uncharacterized protein LOC104610243 n=1 Tax=Nelumbo nucifera TaxID=4432 RepID=A0A1U8B6F2_NELNU|nr:PREDICTED: uncharacterized protein LOC104610243 [Nelumbo nucifera]